MKVKFYKPTSPARRFASKHDFSNLSKDKPEKKLTHGKNRISGRNNSGKTCVRFRGGGHKRKLREIDFKYRKNIPAKVHSIEYDPNRSARISLLHYFDGEKKYIIAPRFFKVGKILKYDTDSGIYPGKNMPIKDIPLGLLIYNIELYPKKGGQLVRSAGTSAQLMAKGKKYAHIKLPSGEIRLIRDECFATIGEVGNKSHEQIISGKAGRSRWLGKRPKVRGVVMNPVDHPHGGGEGKTSGGRHPVSPWGQPAKGYKTRKKNKKSNDYIVKRRK
jgi:large subunit ribosomal protein L2